MTIRNAAAKSMFAALMIAGSLAGPALAADPEFIVSIKDHKFEPSRIEAPANKAFVLRVKNLDASAEEFESKELRLEKIIPGNSEAVLRVRALKPGEYPFVGEFNEATAKGVIVVK